MAEKQLKQLLINKEYQQIILFTEDKIDNISLTYRMWAYYETGQNEKCLSLIEQYGELLKHRFDWLVKAHLDILLNKQDYLQAQKELTKYKELPYRSMEIEQTLTEYDQKIIDHHRQATRKIDIEALLKSDDPLRIKAALSHISNKEYQKHLPQLLAILQNCLSEQIKTDVLLLLIEKKYQHQLTIVKNDLTYQVVPALLIKPEDSSEYYQTSKYIEKEIKDPVKAKLMFQLFTDYQKALFPEDALELDGENSLLAMKLLIERYYQTDEENTFLSKFNETRKIIIKALADQIERQLIDYK